MNINKLLTIAALAGLVYGCGGGGTAEKTVPVEVGSVRDNRSCTVVV